MRLALAIYVVAALSHMSIHAAQQHAGMLTPSPVWVTLVVGVAWPLMGAVGGCYALEICQVER